jgi:nicotinate-nucleotide pyrophosphorylase (carboxylating)
MNPIFTTPIERSIDRLIDLALDEDIGPMDVTTENLIDPDQSGSGCIFAKEPCVVAGIDVAGRVFKRLDAAVVLHAAFRDGDLVSSGQRILEISGKLRALLSGERVALNFLQRLSGIATMVRSFLEKVASDHVRLVDTRKTTPGLRALEKYAVRVGGGHNHRMGLYDGVLIKDNHIAACGGIGPAVSRARERIHHLMKVEVEAADLEQVREAVAAGADIIMLDNMGDDQIRKALKIIRGCAIVEVSGGVTIDKLKRLAAAGVDLISIGALTHSARSVDLSMTIDSPPVHASRPRGTSLASRGPQRNTEK